MSDTTLVKAEINDEPNIGDYFALLKPRVMILVVFTALVGIIAAPVDLHPFTIFVSITFIALGGGASGALNMWYESDLDSLMRRTRNRPIPSGKITSDEAKAFGFALAGISVVMLGLAANWFAALLLLFTIFFYVVIYTMWLKRWTPQNIVIGGAAGALPPVIGWAAVTGGLSVEPLILFAVIFMWTPPHFWALALFRNDDYLRANVPMMPVVAGEAETRRQILIYAVLLAPLALAPAFIGMTSMAYGVVVAALGLNFIRLSWVLYRHPDDAAAKRLFAFSILYLFLLFLGLVIDRLLVTSGVLAVL